MPHSRKHAQKLLREMPSDPRELLSRPNYHDSEFLHVYLNHCDDLLFHEPRVGLRYAQVAPTLAQAAIDAQLGQAGTRSDERDVGRRKAAEGLPRAYRELLVKSHVVLGGAQRATGQLSDAEETYQTALQLAKAGIGPIELAKLHHRLAVLRIDQRRFSEAEKLCKGAIETYRSKGDQRTLATALATLGAVYLEARRFPEAIDCCGKVLANPAANARATDAAVFNLADAFSQTTDRDALASADRWIARARRAIRNQRRSLLRYKLSMIEGRLCLRLALDRHAERLFWRARRGFMRIGAPFEIAMVALELSVPFHRERRWKELEQLAADTWKRFRELSADSEAIAALSLWMDALQGKKLEDQLVSDTRSKLTRRLQFQAGPRRRR